MAASRNITTPAHGNTIADDQALVSQNLSKMMSATADAAGEALPKITRRGIIAAMAAMAPTVALAAPILTPPATNLPIDVAENPELIAAYDRFLQARAEVTSANEALEWLADEWRHLWPLAPEALFGCANANSYPVCAGAERDIVGDFIFRDTIELTTRFKGRPGQKVCFSVMSPNEAEESLSFWKNNVPKGRTAKSLAKSTAYREKYIKQFEHALVLARQYEAETSRLRADAGVEEVKRRIAVAKEAVVTACTDISKTRADTGVGLRIKAEALEETGLRELFSPKGPFAEVGRFIDAALNLHSVTA